MNHAWNNNSNNASGFVYFNTSDFLAFNDSYNSPKCNRFSPVHYSSPNKFQNARNFHGRPPGRNSFRYHNSRDGNSFNSSNRSFSSSFNNSRKQHTQVCCLLQTKQLQYMYCLPVAKIIPRSFYIHLTS